MTSTPRTDALIRREMRDKQLAMLDESLRLTYQVGSARTLARQLEQELGDALYALRKLVERCDGEEGVRADGSNIDTRAAHALLDKGES